MLPSDFSGIDFDLAIGEVYGLREWRVDQHGRLRALHLDDVPPWRPGVNVATCQRASTDPFRGLFPAGSTLLPASFAKAFGLPGPDDESPEPVKREHVVPNEGCRCGFYAYTDPRHDELKAKAAAPTVLGVIRGTGRTLIGTRGFRCEKAEIVALLDPIAGGLRLTRERLRRRQGLRRIYPDVPLLETRRDLRAFAPIESLVPPPTSDEFWSLP